MDKAINMSQKGIFVLLCMLIILSSCRNTQKDNCRNVACTALFAMVTIKVVDNNQKPISLDDHYTVRTSTADTFRSIQSPIESGTYVVMDDNYLQNIINQEVEFTFIGLKNNSVVVNEPFTVSADCCHISKRSGAETVVVQ